MYGPIQGTLSMRKYVQKKPIKWGFKWWCFCASSRGYLIKFDLDFGKKKALEVNLRAKKLVKVRASVSTSMIFLTAQF